MFKFLKNLVSKKKGLPDPLRVNVNLENFDWKTENTRYSFIGEGKDLMVFLTVVYQGKIKK